MFPKLIHYCWFGRNPLPDSAKKCIDSWRKFFPDYEIKEWNEDNFNVYEIPYTSEAYALKKYAFVSDYARFKILYEYGGIYFDTDVEVIKSFDDIIERGPFMGAEINGSFTKNSFPQINPGLGLASYSKNKIYHELIEIYKNLHFISMDGSINYKTIVKYTTELLVKNGLAPNNDIQNIEGISIYPSDFFNPFDDTTGRLKISCNTHSIHWYSKTWINESKFRRDLARVSHRILGSKLIPRIKKFIADLKNHKCNYSAIQKSKPNSEID